MFEGKFIVYHEYSKRIRAYIVDRPWKSTFTLLGILGSIASIYGMFASEENKVSHLDFFSSNYISLLTTLAILYLLHKICSLYGENILLRKLQSKKYIVNPDYSRFEDIAEIKCPHIPYTPLIYYPMGSTKPEGIGVQLLEIIFEPLKKATLDYSSSPSRWSDILGQLESGKDIVLTPLFQTRTRMAKVHFSSPVFYSDIGIFVRKETAEEHSWKNLTFSDARGYLKGFDSLHLYGIDGELSGQLAIKHLPRVKGKNINIVSGEQLALAQDQIVPHLISSLVSDKYNSDIVFTEVMQTEQTDEYKNGSIVNILKNKELLYPVGFAVARGNEHMLNYINLRLLDIETSHPGGMIGLIQDVLKKDQSLIGYFGNDIDNIDLKRYFVRGKESYGTL